MLHTISISKFESPYNFSEAVITVVGRGFLSASPAVEPQFGFQSRGHDEMSHIFRIVHE